MIGLSIGCLIACAGCVKSRNTKVIIRPMTDLDYHAMPPGSTYTNSSQFPGHFITDAYLADAYDASVDEMKAK